jgi:hypothetical protein
MVAVHKAFFVIPASETRRESFLETIGMIPDKPE